LNLAPLAFITGASSGLGQALAARYAKAGWRLALVARRGPEMQAWALAQGLDAEWALVLAADVARPDSIIAAAEQCQARFGLPNVVIAAAGFSVGFDTGERADLAVLHDTFATHNLGLAATFHAFVQPMQQRGSGTLVGLASVNAIRGLPGHGATCASKAAVVSYCESLRVECRASGVRVVTLLPGYVATPLTAANPYAMPFLLQPADFAERAFQAITAGRSYAVIPWQMGWVAKGLRLLPNPLFDRLFAGRGRKARRM
jgi:NAD(P)-dependent dehydrogenase (short-subunit alcohol dehydrogenase family)